MSTDIQKEDGESLHNTEQNKKSTSREIRGWVISIIIAVAVALTLRFFVFEFIRVEGPSMEPTLYTDEFVFMEKVSYSFGPPSRGDIIVCSFPNEDKSFVKRVIGIPGDTLKIEDGVLYLNGEPSYDYYKDYINFSLKELTVAEDCVFVMGDNRNDSRDSRYQDVGPIPYDKILGRAVFIIWPINMIRGL